MPLYSRDNLRSSRLQLSAAPWQPALTVLIYTHVEIARNASEFVLGLCFGFFFIRKSVWALAVCGSARAITRTPRLIKRFNCGRYSRRNSSDGVYADKVFKRAL